MSIKTNMFQQSRKGLAMMCGCFNMVDEWVKTVKRSKQRVKGQKTEPDWEPVVCFHKAEQSGINSKLGLGNKKIWSINLIFAFFIHQWILLFILA